jgi:hypothetical protein
MSRKPGLEARFFVSKNCSANIFLVLAAVRRETRTKDDKGGFQWYLLYLLA